MITFVWKVEADATLGPGRRFKQAADGFENDAKLRVVLFLHGRDFAGQIFMRAGAVARTRATAAIAA